MKPSVLTRYLIKEVGLVWGAVTVVLLAVLLTNYFARVMSDAAGGELPASAILQVVALTTVGYFGPLVPAAFFLAIVLAFGRLYRDSEMPALAAVGVGPGGLYRSLLPLVVPVALLVAWLSLWGAPWAQRAMAEVRAEAQQNLELESLRAGRFLTSRRAQGMFYVQEMGDDGRMREIFLQTELDDQLVLVTAREATLTLLPESGERYLVLRDGYRYESLPESGGWQIVRFEEHGLRLDAPPEVSPKVRRKGLPVQALLAEPERDNIVELQWRLSMPLMVFVLAWIAVPLAKSQPREGRYAKMVSAVLVFAIYLNLLKTAQDWVSDGKLPLSVGIWWVHLVFAVFGLALLARRFGVFQRSPEKGAAQ